MPVAEHKPKRRQISRHERPHCPEHGDTMYANRSAPKITYYYCMVEGCEHSKSVGRKFSNDGTKRG